MKKTVICLALVSLLASPAVPQAAVLESPAKGAALSGIGFISGWKCDASNITATAAMRSAANNTGGEGVKTESGRKTAGQRICSRAATPHSKANRVAGSERGGGIGVQRAVESGGGGRGSLPRCDQDTRKGP